MGACTHGEHGPFLQPPAADHGAVPSLWPIAHLCAHRQPNWRCYLRQCGRRGYLAARPGSHNLRGIANTYIGPGGNHGCFGGGHAIYPHAACRLVHHGPYLSIPSRKQRRGCDQGQYRPSFTIRRLGKFVGGHVDINNSRKHGGAIPAGGHHDLVRQGRHGIVGDRVVRHGSRHASIFKRLHHGVLPGRPRLRCCRAPHRAEPLAHPRPGGHRRSLPVLSSPPAPPFPALVFRAKCKSLASHVRPDAAGDSPCH